MAKKNAERRKTEGGRRKKTGRRKTGRREAVSRKQVAARRPKAGSRKQQAESRKPSTASKAAATIKGALKGAVAAVTKRLPGAAIDAIALLEKDHRRMEELLKRGGKTGDRAVKERKALLDTLAAELTLHETIEERVLYPALKEYPEARDIVLEGFQEHHVADLIMKELYETSVDDEDWGAKFKVLKESIEHHIQEEEGPMFRTARGVMNREQLLELGARMARMTEDAARGRLMEEDASPCRDG